MAKIKVTLSLPAEQVEHLKSYADSRMLAMSTVVQLAIEEYLKSGEGAEGDIKK